MNKGLTVRELLKMCQAQVTKWNGDKHILISDDDEGNGFHTLFYGIDDTPEGIQYALELEHDHHNADEIVVLG